MKKILLVLITVSIYFNAASQNVDTESANDGANNNYSNEVINPNYDESPISISNINLKEIEPEKILNIMGKNSTLKIEDAIYTFNLDSNQIKDQDSLILKKTALEPMTTAFVTAASIGAIKGGIEYAIKTISLGEPFSGSSLAAYMTYGAAEGMTFLATFLFPSTALTVAFGVYQSPDVNDYFVKKLEGFYDFIGTGISNVWQVLSGSFKDEVTNLSFSMESLINPAVLALLDSNGSEPEYSKLLPYWVDFDESIDKNTELTFSGMEYDTYYGTWKMTSPGTSFLEIIFELDIAPEEAYISLLHLTSFAENAENNGYSPVDVFINGVRIKDNYDVAQIYGDHSWHSDNWPIGAYLRTGSNSFRIEMENDPWATTFYWIRNISIQEGKFVNLEPQLTNARFSPLNGNQNTDFEFLVDYYDADEDKPIKAQIYIPSIHSEFQDVMTLKLGDDSNGTYSFTTKLPIGANNYYAINFLNTSNQEISTGFAEGPTVHNSSNMTLIPILDCGVDETYDFKLRYSINDEPYTEVLLKVGENGGIEVPPLGSVNFSLSSSENYTFENYRLMQDGELEREYSGSGTTINFTEFASGIFELQINSDYTPQLYNISGTINNEDNTPYSDALNVTLSSSQDNKSLESSSGSFSFGNVKGGIPIKIEGSGVPVGYSINPEIIPIRNLYRDITDLRFSIGSDDHIAPSIQITQKPSEQSTISNITFSWIGSDDVTPEPNLLYQYKLDGFDASWSVASNSKTTNYNLSNGIYKFNLSSIDEVGNISNVPTEYSFIVNANPWIESVEKFDDGVWASKIIISTDGLTLLNKNVVMLQEHSLTNIESIMPIRLYRLNETNPCGALDKIAESLEIDTVFISQIGGYIFNIPDDFPESNKLEYIIEWGRKSNFGWQETNYIPKGFPNISDIDPFNSDITEHRYLDENMNLWRAAVSKKKIETDDKYIYNSWTYFDKSNTSEVLINEKEIEYIEGSWVSGERYTRPECSGAKIINIENKNYFVIREEKYERTYPVSGYLDTDYERYVIKIIEPNGTESNSVIGDWNEAFTYLLPNNSIHNNIWLTNRFYDDINRALFFTIINSQGNILSTETEYYKKENTHRLYDRGVFEIGLNNAILFFEDSWETAERDDRKNICFQIRSADGSLVKSTTILNPPLLNEAIEEHDEYDFEVAISDNLGRVWITYEHNVPGTTIDDHYYVVLNADGSILKGPILTNTYRDIMICDKDGFIWTADNDYLYLIDQDFNENVFASQGMIYPNQNVGNNLANVDYYDYSIFDRWSPNIFSINFDVNTVYENIQVFNLPINSDIQVENIELEVNGSLLISNEGKLPGIIEEGLTDNIALGSNVFSINQNSLLGGGLIISFPLVTDEDNDGVANNLDICPDTPSGESVNENGCSASQTVGIDAINVDSQSVSIYPNPVKDFLSIKIQEESLINIRVYNSLGILVKSEIISDKKVDVSWLSPGIYLLEVQDSENLLRRLKFIKGN